ncbi:MAG: hypothetical protein A2Y38_04115 [Spirochaetes bacterium GWB1_59_5]|nr:MAG: hypothetical protein A2Y38_04115 [Spirochaetes bacterium GWB1_59_5]
MTSIFTPDATRITTYSDPPVMPKTRVRAEGSASYEDFAELLVRLGSHFLPNVRITEEDPKSDATTPVVTFEVIHEAPLRNEVKPRPRDVFPETQCVLQNTNLECTQPRCSNYPYWPETCGIKVYPSDASFYQPEGKAFMVWGQVLVSTVQFNCWGETGPEAERLSRRFRDFMFTVTGVLKQRGVRDIIFLQRLRDRTVTAWRENVFSRSLQYKVELEELYVQEYGIISKILVELTDQMRSFSEREYLFNGVVAIT